LNESSVASTSHFAIPPEEWSLSATQRASVKAPSAAASRAGLSKLADCSPANVMSARIARSTAKSLDALDLESSEMASA
jgi:hypothetical protein